MNSPPEFDVLVAGAGPAGCATALTLRQQAAAARILLLEPGNYPRHKVCGEFVSDEGIAALHRLFTPAELAPLLQSAPRIEQLRIFIEGSCFRANIKPAAYSIPRFQLDAFLWQACRSRGIDCRQATAQQIQSEDVGSSAVFSGTESISAMSVVNAAGRWSRLSATQAANKTNGNAKWIGLKAHFHFDEPHPDASVDLYFFAGGYCGVQPVGDHAVNVCAMVRSDAATNLSDVFALHPALTERNRNWRQATELVSTAPLVFHQPQPLNGNVVNVGDAAAFIDPFLGDGITLALLSGNLAGESLSQWLRDGLTHEDALADYQRQYQRHLTPLFRRAARLRDVIDLPRPLRSLALQAMRVPALANFLVRQTRASRLSA
jgi:flavin-dependent dehydrogenase